MQEAWQGMKKVKVGYINSSWDMHWLGTNKSLWHDEVRKNKADHPGGKKVRITIEELDVFNK